ncbi:MAG: TIGR01777 family oxidoreductase [Cellvibrionaceae bacterium]
MHILVTGGTGFIGQPLVELLLARGENLTLLCRNFNKAKAMFGDRVNLVGSLTNIALEADAVINLAGEPIVDKRWSDQRKQVLKDSRIGVTSELIEWIKQSANKPTILISGSAIGYYGNYPEDKQVTEINKPRSCFASELCQEWEATALEAESLGVRVCLVRTGIVLAAHGGALKRMLLPFKMGLGGRIGNGEQWFSWIHLQDMLSLLLFLLDNDRIRGAVNATAAHPVTNDVFSKQLASALNRPALLPMPEFMAKLLFGEASELLLEGQKVVPKKLLDHGFKFEYAQVSTALRAICSD